MNRCDGYGSNSKSDTNLRIEVGHQRRDTATPTRESAVP